MQDLESGMFREDTAALNVRYQATLRREATICNKQLAGGKSQIPWWTFETPRVFHDPPMSDEAWIRHYSWLRHSFQPLNFLMMIYSLWPMLLWTTACAAGLWEARLKMGNLELCARSLSRLMTVWLRTDPEIAKESMRWLSLISAATSTYLRHQSDYLKAHADVLSNQEMKWLLASRHPPLAILQVITTLIRRSRIHPQQLVNMEEHLFEMDIDIARCELYRSTAMPLAYTSHTSRFLMIYLTMLPFGLVGTLGWITIPATFTVSLLLLGIEHAGIMLEQPMMVLPLTAMAASCRRAVEVAAATQSEIDELFPEGICVMKDPHAILSSPFEAKKSSPSTSSSGEI